MAATIALSSAPSLPVRRAAAPARRESGILAVLSTALELSRQVGDNGGVSAKTIASVRKQILAA